MFRRIAPFVSATAMLLVAAFSLPAQDYRGQVAGKVLDPTGAAVPGALIKVINIATNSESQTRSDGHGNYATLYLPPSMYMVTVEAPGFKKLVRQGIEVRVGDSLQLDLTLEVGTAQETVNVTAEALLLETTTASSGQVIATRTIADLPLSDGNPFVLHRLAPGVIYNGDLKFSRPFDNGGTSSIVVDGAPGANEFTLDGAPNMASGGRVAFVPPRDVVEEFKVETANFDAQDGHTAGANVNVALKSGTNQIHGTAYEFFRNDKLAANDFFLNRSGRPRDSLRYNLYGGTVGGPLWFPKLYNGKNRTFFFFGYEGIKDRFPEPGLYTVPTQAQRNGDLSSLLPLGSAYQIYDPLTATQEGSRIRRQPLAGNIIPQDRISPIAKNYLALYPLPNQAGDREGRNNFVSANTRGDDFYSLTFRGDHQMTAKQKAFFRYTYNNRRESRGNWSGETAGIHATGNFLFRINYAGTFDHVYAISPTTVVNWRAGYSRFKEPSIRQHEGQFDPKSLGFPAQTATFFGPEKYVPRFEIGQFSVLGDSIGGGLTYNIYSFQPTVTHIAGGGKHQIRAGYDFRAYRQNNFGAGHAAGRYDFGTAYTRGPLDNSTAAPIGQDYAAFLLGQPTGGLIDRNASRANQSLYNAFFVQDDFKVSSRLTLNLGLRYEYEGAVNERYNRNTRGFDFSSASPIEAAARAAYARSPLPELAAADFKVKGGYLFADSSHRAFWNADGNNFEPRVGVAYRVSNHTVIRGGIGVYVVPFNITGTNQPGFSQSTSIVPSLNAGLSFVANLSNPFPDGVVDPPGARDGLSTFLGRGVTYYPLDPQNPKATRFEIGAQHEVRGWLIQAGYVGNRGSDLTVTTNILDAIPKQYLSTASERDQATIDRLSANVTNPFAGLIPGQGLNGTTTSRSQLLRPYPQFTSIGSVRYDGSSRYHSLQSKVEKRLSKGFSLLVSYTFSRLEEKASFLNEQDTEFEERLNGADRRHRIVFSGIYELPFGRSRHWGSNWNRGIDALFGGWQVSGIAQFQSGGPLNFDDNYLFRGDRNSVAIPSSQRTVDRWFNTDGFEKTTARQLGSNYRTAPRQFPGVKTQGLNLWDLSVIKAFMISESVRLQFRTEFLNAFNHAQFSDPNRSATNSNFGKITGQSNLPRNIQLALRLVF